MYKAGRESARILFYEENIDPKTRIIVFKDVDENNSKCKSYQQMMELGESGYTREKYAEFCEWWGVYVLQDTTGQKASDVYADYKSRWSIETFNNYIKNDTDFNALKEQNYYCAHGFDFIMLVTGLSHVGPVLHDYVMQQLEHILRNPVVAVNKAQPLPFCVVDACVSRLGESRVGLMDHTDTRILQRPTVAHLTAAIRRTVVHKHQTKMRIALA